MPGMGQRYRYRDLTFWAENGLIRIEDARDGTFDSITRREALEFAYAKNQEISYIPWGDEREEAHSLVQSLISVVNDAKAQGDPMNPAVTKHMAKEVKNTRRAKLLLPSGTVPGTKDPRECGYNQIPSHLEKKIILGH